MIKYKVCPLCNGRKEKVGLGNIKISCKNCDGIGYVVDDSDYEEELLSRPVKPTRGRKKKEVVEDKSVEL